VRELFFAPAVYLEDDNNEPEGDSGEDEKSSVIGSYIPECHFR